MRRLLFISFPLFLLAGCVTAPSIPAGAYTLEPEYLAEHQVQTHRFDNIQEAQLLAASTDVFQDAGFVIDEADSKVGIVTGSKKRYASTQDQRAVGYIAPLFGVEITAEHSQDIYASLLVRPATNENGQTIENNFVVHVLFQSTVLVSPKHVSCNPLGFLVGSFSCQTTEDRFEYRTLKEPKLYQEFFDGLGKAIFIEQQGI